MLPYMAYIRILWEMNAATSITLSFSKTADFGCFMARPGGASFPVRSTSGRETQDLTPEQHQNRDLTHMI